MDKNVVVTGSSKGIGRETALLFAKAGWNVCITYRQDRHGGEKTLADCKAAAKDVGSDCILLHLDVADKKSREKAFGEIKNWSSPITLINNAGVLARTTLLTSTDEIRDSLFQTNLFGPLDFTKLFLAEGLIESVIYVGSDAGTYARPNLDDYGMTKAALKQHAKQFALDFPNIKVYAVSPGMTSTDMNGHAGGMNPLEPAQAVFDTVIGKILQPSGKEIGVGPVYSQEVRPTPYIF